MDTGHQKYVEKSGRGIEEHSGIVDRREIREENKSVT